MVNFWPDFDFKKLQDVFLDQKTSCPDSNEESLASQLGGFLYLEDYTFLEVRISCFEKGICYLLKGNTYFED